MADFSDVASARRARRAAEAKAKGEPYRATGQRAGGRTLRGSDVNPQRFKPKADPAVEVIVYSGRWVKRRYQVPKSKVPREMARHAGNHVRAKAIEVMSGDLAGESFSVAAGYRKPRRWSSYPS